MLAQRFESKTLRRRLNHLYFGSTYIMYTHYVNKCFNIYVHSQLCRLLSANVIIPNYTGTFQSDVKQWMANNENTREGEWNAAAPWYSMRFLVEMLECLKYTGSRKERKCLIGKS